MDHKTNQEWIETINNRYLTTVEVQQLLSIYTDWLEEQGNLLVVRWRKMSNLKLQPLQTSKESYVKRPGTIAWTWFSPTRETQNYTIDKIVIKQLITNSNYEAVSVSHDWIDFPTRYDALLALAKVIDI